MSKISEISVGDIIRSKEGVPGVEPGIVSVVDAIVTKPYGAAPYLSARRVGTKQLSNWLPAYVTRLGPVVLPIGAKVRYVNHDGSFSAWSGVVTKNSDPGYVTVAFDTGGDPGMYRWGRGISGFARYDLIVVDEPAVAATFRVGDLVALNQVYGIVHTVDGGPWGTLGVVKEHGTDVWCVATRCCAGKVTRLWSIGDKAFLPKWDQLVTIVELTPSSFAARSHINNALFRDGLDGLRPASEAPRAVDPEFDHHHSRPDPVVNNFRVPRAPSYSVPSYNDLSLVEKQRVDVAAYEEILQAEAHGGARSIRVLSRDRQYRMSLSWSAELRRRVMEREEVEAERERNRITCQSQYELTDDDL